MDPADFAGHPGDDFGIRLGVQCRGAAVHGEHLAANGGGDLDGDCGFGGRLGVFVSGSLVAGHSGFRARRDTQRHGQRERDGGGAKNYGCHALPLCLSL
jgi:hypothetical protein